MTARKRLAIIGGGMGGVATAWLCDDEWDVTIFEAKDKLGGNSDSETLRAGPRDLTVDLGAQFFHPETHPTYVALVELLGLRRFAIPGSLAVLPLDGRVPAFSSTSALRTPRHALDFVIFSYASRKMATRGDYDVTMASWVDSLPVSQRFKSHILLPWLTASEGHPLDETKRSSARAILELFAPTQPKSPLKKSLLFSLELGFEGAIQALVGRCEHLTIQTRSPIVRLEKIDASWYVSTSSARSGPFDAVVVNAPPWESKKLVTGLHWAGDLVALLDRYEHREHRLAIHDQPTYVHRERRHRALANVGTSSDSRSELSISYDAALGVPTSLYKSWVTYRDRAPEGVRFERAFEHSIKTPDMMRAARQLRAWQGREGLWFAGQFTSGIDLQESALRSAIDVGRAISPSSPQLAALERRATPTRGQGASSVVHPIHVAASVV